jgi:hypothetical protein
MSFLDTIAPRRGPKQRRYGIIFLSKTAFYSTVAGFLILVAVSLIFFDTINEIPKIPATRVDTEVISGVQEYLKTTTHRGFLNQDEPSSCWGAFEDLNFHAKYHEYGRWRVDAFYKLVRYYWWVDDESLAVTIDDWLGSINPQIEC